MLCQRVSVDYSCISRFVGQTVTALTDITFAVHFYIYFFSPVASFCVNFLPETQMYHQLINTCREDLIAYAAPLFACPFLRLFFSPVVSFRLNFLPETQMYHQLINTCREDLIAYAAPLVACRLLSLICLSCTLLGLLNSPSRTFSTARCRGCPSHGLEL